MITPEPDFMEWVEVTQEGWKLKKEAPPEIVEAFNKYMKSGDIIKE